MPSSFLGGPVPVYGLEREHLAPRLQRVAEVEVFRRMLNDKNVPGLGFIFAFGFPIRCRKGSAKPGKFIQALYLTGMQGEAAASMTGL